MPCKVCEYYFQSKPCKDKPMNIITNDINVVHNVRLLSRKFNLMKHKCPCIDCLVKVICTNVCDRFDFEISKEGEYNRCQVNV